MFRTTQQSRHRNVEETLASSSRSHPQQQDLYPQNSIRPSLFSHHQHLHSPSQGQKPNKKAATLFSGSKAIWILLALFLVPYVQALPSSTRISPARRSQGLERGSAGKLFASQSASGEWKVENGIVELNAGSGYLDRSGAGAAAKAVQVTHEYPMISGGLRHTRPRRAPQSRRSSNIL